jgi:hypothetical protein
MKKARYLSIPLIALLALSGRAVADPEDDAPSKNPYAQVDPDGVPLEVTQGPKHSRAPEPTEAQQKQAAALEARSRNWLLIEYENQMRTHSDRTPDKDNDANLYLQLSLDKDISKLAGLTTTPDAGPTPTLQPLAGTSRSGQAAPTLRPEAPVNAQTGGFLPLIKPLTSPAALTTQVFSTSFSSNLSTSYSGFSTPPNSAAPAPTPTPHSSAYTQATDLQTPGMVAAGQNPTSETTTPDLSLDSLPGETPEETRAREEASAPMALPAVMDADALHQQQTSGLKLPVAANAPKTAATPPPAAPKAIPVNPADQPLQANQAPQITPVHAAIANPYDILNR